MNPIAALLASALSRHQPAQKQRPANKPLPGQQFLEAALQLQGQRKRLPLTRAQREQQLLRAAFPNGVPTVIRHRAEQYGFTDINPTPPMPMGSMPLDQDRNE